MGGFDKSNPEGLFRVLSELNMKSKSNLFTFFTHVHGHIVHDTIVKKTDMHWYKNNDTNKPFSNNRY